MSEVNHKYQLEYKYGKMPAAVICNPMMNTEHKLLYSILYALVDYNNYIHTQTFSISLGKLAFLSSITQDHCRDIMNYFIENSYIQLEVPLEQGIGYLVYVYSLTDRMIKEYLHNDLQLMSN